MKDSGWPPVAYEDRLWQVTLDDPRIDVFQQMRLERPYRAALPASIAGQAVELSLETLSLVDRASAELVRFDADMAALPAPMPAVMLRSESASSSQIEQLTTNARNLALATLGLANKQNAAVVAGNVRAMSAALKVTSQIALSTVLDIHQALMTETATELAGQWRSEQVWIGVSSLSPHDADFVPPHHERLPECLADWVAFAGRTDVPALAQAAVAHAQFETIHPFIDGNGRTGRVLVQSLLRQRGLIRSTTVPVSAGLLRDTRRYFAALDAYREGELDPIVEQMAQATLAAVDNARLLAADVVRIRQDWIDGLGVRSDSSVWALVNILFAQPVITAGFVAEQLDISDRAARNAITVLEDGGLLSLVTAGRRNQAWQAGAILAAMDAFSLRAGRRGWREKE